MNELIVCGKGTLSYTILIKNAAAYEANEMVVVSDALTNATIIPGTITVNGNTVDSLTNLSLPDMEAGTNADPTTTTIKYQAVVTSGSEGTVLNQVAIKYNMNDVEVNNLSASSCTVIMPQNIMKDTISVEIPCLKERVYVVKSMDIIEDTIRLIDSEDTANYEYQVQFEIAMTYYDCAGAQYTYTWNYAYLATAPSTLNVEDATLSLVGYNQVNTNTLELVLQYEMCSEGSGSCSEIELVY